MKVQYKVFLPLIFGLLIALGMILGAKFYPSENLANYSDFHKMKEVMYHINSSYVDSVNSDELIESAINKILFDLDPHSIYISAKELKEMNEDLQGDFEGIGIEFNILNDSIIVISPISGGPAEELGILAGDKIISIEDENVAGIGISNSEVIKRLKGKKGTKVKIVVYRRNEPKLLNFTIIRDKIPIYSVDAHYMIDNRIGYIKINRFSYKTAEEFEDAVIELKEKGLEDLILDLRGNPGGSLNSAFKVTNQFFNSKKLIVYTKGRSRERHEYESTRKGSFINGNLTILIDEGSASASEIVSGAIQDWDRGIIIGRRSFGKGLVQEQIMLSDHSALRLTVAEYFTPSGRCIQKPYLGGHADYYMDLMRRYENGEYMHKDSIDFPDSLKYTTAQGRIVYGGGGIMPDIFIPLDTSDMSDYLSEVNRQGLFYRFVLEYVDKERIVLQNKYKDVKNFDDNFFITKTLLNSFIQFVEQNGINRDGNGIEKSIEVITTQIKALIGRQLFGTNAYYKIINSIDKEYLKAIDVFRTKKYEELGIKSFSG